jgi:hypothetical protein
MTWSAQILSTMVRASGARSGAGEVMASRISGLGRAVGEGSRGRRRPRVRVHGIAPASPVVLGPPVPLAWCGDVRFGGTSAISDTSFVGVHLVGRPAPGERGRRHEPEHGPTRTP